MADAPRIRWSAAARAALTYPGLVSQRIVAHRTDSSPLIIPDRIWREHVDGFRALGFYDVEETGEGTDG